MISSLFFRYQNWKGDLDFEMAWQSDFTKKFPTFPKNHAPIYLVKIDSASLALHHTKELNR